VSLWLAASKGTWPQEGIAESLLPALFGAVLSCFVSF